MVDFLILVLMQELPTLPEHLHSPLCFSRVGVHHYLVLCSALHTIVSVFVLFLVAIVLSFLRLTVPGYPFGI
jgi:hypothetical protein